MPIFSRAKIEIHFVLFVKKKNCRQTQTILSPSSPFSSTKTLIISHQTQTTLSFPSPELLQLHLKLELLESHILLHHVLEFVGIQHRVTATKAIVKIIKLFRQ
ncbi:unnamed protein product [Coffea canephora]|uniref:DH200=94 genomic scaffold, scaffold_67 n=1 Tax=Coffea canephora TaxID=49390 RepID=A0A068UVS4_COFCA|nr:unnamed protein product [Coffea canephora]